MSSESNNQNYTDSSIQVLGPLESVRKHPGMYVGDSGIRGLHHLIWEILDNAVDEVVNGGADEVTLTLKSDHVVSISDNGRGIPVGINPQTNTSNLIVIFTVLHAGGKFDNRSYKTSGGLHGVGATCVNALSEFLEVNVWKNGEHHNIVFRNGGKIDKAPHLIGTVDSSQTGTTVTWKPDFTIFEKTNYDVELIENRLNQLAYLNAKKKFVFVDENRGIKKEFYYEKGIVDWIKNINEGKQIINDIFSFSTSGEVKNRRNPSIQNPLSISCSFQYSQEDEHTLIKSFCNNINTEFGGSHLEAFKEGVLISLRNRAVEAKIIKNPDEFEKSDIISGLSAIVAIGYSNPEYSGQTKGILSNVEIKKFIRESIELEFDRFLEEHSEQKMAILEKIKQNMNLRLKIEMTKQVDKKLALEGFLSFAGKLADCTIKDQEFSELYVVEGDSAGGSAKSARNREYQAILPIKGKLMNVWKQKNIASIVKNKEIKSLISSVGCSYGKDFDISKLRYNKLIIMTDADVDGSHIRILILTFIFRFMRPLVENGYVYIAQPPLYRASTNRESHYLFDEKAKNDFLKSKSSRWEISRFKGLGEMSPQQLWDTTMDPTRRTLCKVDMDDEINVLKAFDDLMGKVVAPRTEFIFKNYLNTKNIDA